MDITESIKAYREVVAVLDRSPEAFKDDYNIRTAKDTLRRLEIEQRFGLPLEEYGDSHYKVQGSYDNWTSVTCYCAGRSISWSDDGRQPEENEWLYVIGFPTGAYIFGENYPGETFKDFFTELKGLGAKYCDTANNSLYFTEENSKQVHEAFWSIFKKYKALVGEEIKRQRKKELQAELAKLEE